MNKKQNRRNSLRRIKKLYVRFTHLHSRQPLNVNYGHSVLLAAMFSHFSANKNLLESNSMSRKSTFSMHKWAISIYLYSCVQTKHGKFLSIASRVCTRDSIVFLEISFLLLKWIKTEAGRVTVSIVRNENYAVQTSSIILSIISLLNKMIVFLLGHYSATFYDFNDENYRKRFVLMADGQHMVIDRFSVIENIKTMESLLFRFFQTRTRTHFLWFIDDRGRRDFV